MNSNFKNNAFLNGWNSNLNPLLVSTYLLLFSQDVFFPNADAPMSHQEVIFFSRFVKAEDATKALKDFKINAFNRDLKVAPGSTVKVSHYQTESFENDDNVEQASKSQKNIDKKIWQQMLNDAQANLEDGITSYQFIYVETHGKVRKGQSRSQLLC